MAENRMIGNRYAAKAEKKDKLINLRVTVAKHKKFMDAAKEDNSTLSAWLIEAGEEKIERGKSKK